MAECSACVRDALGYAEEYKEVRKRRRTSRAALMLAAAVVVAVGSWAVWSLQQKPTNLEIARQGPTDQSPKPPGDAGRGKQQDKGPAIAQYETVTIQLPSRLRASTAAASQIILGRGRLLLEIRLSNGSPEGKYKFRIVDKSGKVRKTARGNGERPRTDVTRLKVPLETSDLSPGDYTLSVLEPGLDEWVDYPLTVK